MWKLICDEITWRRQYAPAASIVEAACFGAIMGLMIALIGVQP